MLSINKFIPFMLLFFFISGLFVATFTPVSAVLVENFWTTKTSMSQTRFGLGVATVDGKIYAIGGFTQSGYLGINEQYDPVTDSWTTLTSMPTPRNNFAIVASQGKIYCIGGITSDGSRGGWFKCGINEVYDVATDSWSTKTSLPFNGSSLQAHVVDGKIFVLNGSDWYVYDPAFDCWTKKTGMPDTYLNAHPFSVVVNDKLMVCSYVHASEVDYDGFGVGDYLKFLVYDPMVDTWSEGKPSSEPVVNITSVVAAVATTGVYAPQRIYALGTYSNLVYDIANDNWSTAKTMSIPRTSFSVAVVDDILYAIGGGVPYTGVTFLAINERYIPRDYHNPSPSVTPPLSSTPDLSKPTSEPSDGPNYPFYTVVAATVLTMCVVVMSLFFYLRKQKKQEE